MRLAAGVSSQVTLTQTIEASGEPVPMASKVGPWHEAVLTATNGNPFAVTLDVPIGGAGQAIDPEDQQVGRADGIVTWSPQLGPGEQAELRYRY